MSPDYLPPALKAIRLLFPTPPKIAIVLGSGLGATVKLFSKIQQISTAELLGFPRSSVAGHAGRIISGWIQDQPILCFQGRVHLYEGFTVKEVTLGVRLAQALGVRTLILTNAAGGIAERMKPGTLMVIEDQIDLQFSRAIRDDGRTKRKPLNIERNPHSNDPSPYAKRLATLAEEAGRQTRLPIKTGILGGLLGPNYETPAEIRMLQRLGIDAVCMSTVAEAAEGARLGMEVLGISCITNQAAGLSGQRLQHSEVVARSQMMQKQLQGLLKNVIPRL